MGLSKHSAEDSYLGYVFQGMYALVLLLSSRDESGVSIETLDDVVLETNIKTLYQIKHSVGSQPRLSIKNDGLWNTIGIWIEQFNSDSGLEFVFVTSATIDDESPLLALSVRGSDRAKLVTELEQEARRVLNAVATAKPGGPIPYKERHEQCRLFLKLSDSDQKRFVDKTSLVTSNFNIDGVDKEVRVLLYNNGTEQTRNKLANRLMEWWDIRVVKGLRLEQSRLITKLELLQKIEQLMEELSDDNLPDDYSLSGPEPDQLSPAEVMEKQIHFVGGGSSRVSRAVLSRWRAIGQRHKWMIDNPAFANRLDEYDKQLIECWSDRFHPMKDDCQNKTEEAKREHGCTLLDWTHHSACSEVSPIRAKWNKGFYVAGMYQELSNLKVVGWHPDYEHLLVQSENSES